MTSTRSGFTLHDAYKELLLMLFKYIDTNSLNSVFVI